MYERPYLAGSECKTEKTIFLDKNENPFRLPPSLREQIRQLVSDVDLNRYPDPEGRALKQVLSEKTGISWREIVIGNGGDEILSLLFTAFAEKGERVVTLSPTFTQYPELCRRHKVEWISVPLRFEESRIFFDEELFLDTVSSCSPSLILLDTPNNPTGIRISNRFLAELSERFEGVLVVDEAYGEFARETFLESFRNRVLPDRLCILKTLSKAWGMAGLRIGYAACSPSVAERIESVRDLYNVGLLPQEIARIVLKYDEWMESRVLSIRYLRDQLVKGINRIPGWRAFESESNFVLVRSPLPISRVREKMEEACIRLKYLRLDEPGDWFRVSVGREEELGAFMNLLQEIE